MHSRSKHSKKFIITSFLVHASILALSIISLEFFAELPVLENTAQHDIISAVVLGDTEKSKVLPTPAKIIPPEVTQQQLAKTLAAEKDAIALKALDKKKLAQKLLAKQIQENIAKDFLADIAKAKKKKQLANKQKLQAQFKKTLQEQTEKTLRQQLLNDDIKLTSEKARYSQGVVNKYKALILQAISENWIVPLQADKSLSCELLIKLRLDGAVEDVQVTRTSGDLALDNSARMAVIKSSPLPVPHNSNEFAPFKQFVLKVKPENIVKS